MSALLLAALSVASQPWPAVVASASVQPDIARPVAQLTPATSTSNADRGLSTRAAGPSGCQSKSTYELCFSSPATQNGKDAAVVRRFIEIFNEAMAGDSLRIAMFRWDIPGVTTALVAAQRRGVHVEVVADSDVTTKAAGRAMLAALPAGSTTVCKGSCLPWRGSGPPPPAQNINHLKLLLADIGGQRSVITSSTNFEGRQYSQYNSLARISDEGLYDFALAYYQRLAAQSLTVAGLTWRDRQRAYAGPPTAMVYPRQGDLVVNTLKQVQCVTGARTVSIMVAVIQRYDVREQIGRLAKAGCTLRIVTTRDLIENWLQAPFKLSDGRTVDLPNDAVRTIVTHDKVYAIHADIKGQERYLVLTGTSNTTCGGLLYNDEMMLRLEGKWAYRAYVGHVMDAFRHAHQSGLGGVPVQARCR